MNRTGIIYTARYMDHDTGGHVENTRRVGAIQSSLLEQSWSDGLEWIEPRAATVDEIAYVHSPRYIDYVKNACAKCGGIAYLNPDTAISPESYEVALLAAGGVIDGIDRLAGGSLDFFFAPVRPPGHHAEYSESLGFCLFNNIAVGAVHARENHGMDRIFILDWDVHHGNGTQHSFESDPAVFYCSLHQYPHYPGTGGKSEFGKGDGLGYTLNFPMRAGSGDADYLYLFENDIVPAIKKYEPQLLLVSAGFDAHSRDPLSSIDLSDECYGAFTKILMGAAGENCPMGMVLEGGYNLGALASSAAQVVGVMAGEIEAATGGAGPTSPYALELSEFIRGNDPFFK